MSKTESQTTKFPDSEDLDRIAKNVAARLRRRGGYHSSIIRDALFKANSDGYAEGHEDQMKARILDAQERRRDAKA